MKIAFFVAAIALGTAPLVAQDAKISEAEVPQPATGSPEAVKLHTKGYAAMGADEIDKGAAFYAQACDLGHAESCGAVGGLHLAGMGFDQDTDKAAAFLKKACLLNDGPSCWLGGTLYANGESYSDALGMLNQACKLNDGDGCAELGKLFWEGHGTAKSVSFAKSRFVKACSLDSADGCYSTAALLINEEGPDAYAMANIYLKKALRIDPEFDLAIEASKKLAPFLK